MPINYETSAMSPQNACPQEFIQDDVVRESAEILGVHNALH